ncbi:MAG: adenosylcobalamin-dependent ribonucleoside-diphosphate reductase [Chloroflexi bacterium]|nr:adenosylcobalamin-dependent ribonucleoside-diphosphate reductase [Chloroflexota bacterium]
MARAPALAALSPDAQRVLEARFLLRDARGHVVETMDALFRRVAAAVAQAERPYRVRNGGSPAVDDWADRFYHALAGLRFLPSPPTLSYAGTSLNQLLPCFVLPMGDTIESIFDTLKQTAIVQESSGNPGVDFSRLRQRGSRVEGSGGEASGSVSFMEVYSTASEVIHQGNRRAGVVQGILRIDHPDVRELASAAGDSHRLTHLRVAVGLTNHFIRAIERDDDFALLDPRTRETVDLWPARDLWEMVLRAIRDHGTPRLFFLDRINAANPTPQLGPLEALSPDLAMSLLPFEGGSLGCLNLASFVRRTNGVATIEHAALREHVRLAIRFLDDVFDVTSYALPEIEQMCRGNRKLGLGVMGFADLLVELGMPYDSDAALRTGEEVMRLIRDEARAASAELARERGPFPNFRGSSLDRAGGEPVRNATLTAIAAMDALALIAGCSPGIEPLTPLGDDALATPMAELAGVPLADPVPPAVRRTAASCGFAADELLEEIAARGSVQGVGEMPDDVRRLLVTAQDVAPAWHVRAQATFQRYCDNGVAKIIRLPRTATGRDVDAVVHLAYALGCNGAVIYRSRRG